MNTESVITNLRIDQHHYIQLKLRAAELGMSVNAYMNWLIQEDVSKAQFPKMRKTKRKKSIYDALLELAHKKYEYKPMGASEDDKIIYGIKDE